MKKFITLMSLISLAGCWGNDHPPQAQYQQPVIVQQAPAQAPVVVQQDNSGTAMVAGAALGAAAAMALSDRDRGYAQQAPVQQNVTHVTHVTQVTNVDRSKTINNNQKTDNVPTATVPAAPPAPPAAAVASVPGPQPLSPAPAAAKPNYAAAGTASPVPTMSQAALTAPKTLNVPAPNAMNAVPNYKPANSIPLTYKQAPALPAPKPAAISYAKPALPAPPKPLALPAPKTASYAPKASSTGYSYKK